MSTDTDVETDETVQITLDGESVEVERNRRLIEVAREQGSYVPGWCHHPGKRPTWELEAQDEVFRTLEGPTTTPPRGVSALDDDEVDGRGDPVRGSEGTAEGCGICRVEVDGELVRACETRVAPGLDVRTGAEAARERQMEGMADLFRHHPHACISCPHKEGCDRISCTMNVPEEKRCCDLLGNCELEKSAEAIDLDWSIVPAYEPLERKSQRTAIFDINWELCIGCNRCVGVCEDHVGAGVWEFTLEDETEQGGHTPGTVGMKRETLAKSGCKFCTSCVEACPTGTLMDNGGGDTDRLPVEYRRSLPDVGFPESTIDLSVEAIETSVPVAGGVYTLYDEDGEVLEINGVADLQSELLAEADRPDAVEVEIELDESFTKRETELIEQYVNEHGHMPGMGGGMDDLF